MKILILTSYITCPPISGGAKRMINPALRLAADYGYEYTFLVPTWNREDELRISRFLSAFPGVRVITCRRVPLINVRRNLPSKLVDSMDANYYDTLRTLLRAETFDCIQVEHSWMAWVVPLVRLVAPETPVVIDLHNVEYKLYELWFNHASGGERKRIENELRLTKQWEEKVWPWFDGCLAVSIKEANIFRAVTQGAVPVCVAPTGGGVDTKFYVFSPEWDGRLRGVMLYLGTLNWEPNVHGLLWFIDHVLPYLKEAYLLIAGAFASPHRGLMKRINRHERIIFIGEVEDDRPLLYASDVFVVPLFVGAGARVKILTAWATGIPVVSTTVGAEGLVCQDQVHILLADEPGTFASNVEILMKNNSFRQHVIINARRLVEQRYSLNVACKIYNKFYLMIQKKGTNRRKEVPLRDWERENMKIEDILATHKFYVPKGFSNKRARSVTYIVLRAIEVLRKEGVGSFLRKSVRYIRKGWKTLW